MPLSFIKRHLWVLGLLLAAYQPVAAQTWQWAVKAAGSSITTIQKTAVDASGNLYVVGSFYGTATFGTTTLTSAGSEDLFVAKLNATGAWQWAVKGGGTGKDRVNDVAVDASGGVLVTGSFMGGPVTFGTRTLTSTGGADIFVARLAATDGAWQWATNTGGAEATHEDAGYAIAVDGGGNVFVTGAFRGPANFGGTILTDATSSAFVAMLNPTGVWQWGARASSFPVGANPVATVAGQALAVDGSGNVFVGGWFSRMVQFGSVTLTANNTTTPDDSPTAFVAKLNNRGQWQWAVKPSGVADSRSNIRDLALDGAGNPYVAGHFGVRIICGSTTKAAMGGEDVFVARLAPADGAWQWLATGGDNGADYVGGLAVDAAGNVRVAGTMASTAKFGTITLGAVGNREDVFVAGLSAAGEWRWAARAGGTNNDRGLGVALNASGHIFVVGDFTSTTAAFSTINLPNPDVRTNGFVARLSSLPTLSTSHPGINPVITAPPRPRVR